MRSAPRLSLLLPAFSHCLHCHTQPQHMSGSQLATHSRHLWNQPLTVAFALSTPPLCALTRPTPPRPRARAAALPFAPSVNKRSHRLSRKGPAPEGTIFSRLYAPRPNASPPPADEAAGNPNAAKRRARGEPVSPSRRAPRPGERGSAGRLGSSRGSTRGPFSPGADASSQHLSAQLSKLMSPFNRCARLAPSAP